MKCTAQHRLTSDMNLLPMSAENSQILDSCKSSGISFTHPHLDQVVQALLDGTEAVGEQQFSGVPTDYSHD